jgi:hypothetical protein
MILTTLQTTPITNKRILVIFVTTILEIPRVAKAIFKNPRRNLSKITFVAIGRTQASFSVEFTKGLGARGVAIVAVETTV